MTVSEMSDFYSMKMKMKTNWICHFVFWKTNRLDIPLLVNDFKFSIISFLIFQENIHLNIHLILSISENKIRFDETC